MSLSISAIANNHHPATHYENNPDNILTTMLNSNPHDNRYLYTQFNPIKYNTPNYQYNATNNASPTISDQQDYSNSNASPTSQPANVLPPPPSMPLGSSFASPHNPEQQQQQQQQQQGNSAYNIYNAQPKYAVVTPPSSARSYQNAGGIVNSIGSTGSTADRGMSYLSYYQPQQPQPQPQQQQPPPSSHQQSPPQPQQPQQQFKYAQPPQSAPAGSSMMAGPGSQYAPPLSQLPPTASHTASSSISNPENLPRFSYSSAAAAAPPPPPMGFSYINDATAINDGSISSASSQAATSMPVPRLVRTTSLQMNRTNLYNNVSGASPYQRVNLQVVGDLATMTENWTPQEFQEKRRLVKFDWTQNGPNLRVEFKPIELDQFDNLYTVVSCLLWQNAEANDAVKTKFYVTSVDVIQLLENLVSQRFAVEEKNRIRRNLQGLRPLTIARSKKNYADFFQQIMKYQIARPRNIEKDVKVFSWSHLGDALLRVLAKYSCDYGLPNGSDSNLSGHPPMLPSQQPAQQHHQQQPLDPHQQQQQQQQPSNMTPSLQNAGFGAPQYQPMKMENPLFKFGNQLPPQLPQYIQTTQNAANMMSNSPMLSAQYNSSSSPALNFTNPQTAMYNYSASAFSQPPPHQQQQQQQSAQQQDPSELVKKELP